MIAVPIRYRKSLRALFAQKLQHAVPSFVVLGDGLDHLSHGARGLDALLGIAEVAVSVGVMATVVWGVRQLYKQTAAAHADHHHQHGVDWIDIAIGAMLAVEALAKYRATAHVPGPTLVLALTMITVGLVHPVLARHGDRRRELRVSGDGISVPGGKFTRLTLKWSEVAAIDIGDRHATVTSTTGRSKRITLADVFQPTAVRDALMQARTFLDASRHAADASIESAAKTP